MPREVIFMNQYCPHTATCPFYKTWSEHQDKRIDVVFDGGEEYECITLMVLNNSERRVPFPMSDELKNKLSNPEESDFACSHITLLNRLENINKNLLEEMNKKRVFIL